MNQTQRILRHLESGKSITPIEALSEFGCFRLSARIKDIRDAGYDVRMELVNNRNGKKFAKYSMPIKERDGQYEISLGGVS